MGLAAAELVADRGAASTSDDLFRSAAFLAAEGATHTLRIESPDRVACVPLVVRELEGGRLDATSPYAYPGALVVGDGPAPEPAEVDWTGTGLVSVFGRERLLGPPWLATGAARSAVLIHDPGSERRLRPRLAEQVRAGERAGWEIETTAGPAATVADTNAFVAAYEQTMQRAEAAPRYFFKRDYFDAALSFERSWLLLARRDGALGAGAIAGVSDSMLHYFLGGTADSAREDSPFKNVVVAMLDLADELGLPLNLGGGITPGDGLQRFKRGFANAELPFFTHEVVCDPEAYAELSAGRDAGDFFPPYRAP